MGFVTTENILPVVETPSLKRIGLENVPLCV
jgi:hypothetical protein